MQYFQIERQDFSGVTRVSSNNAQHHRKKNIHLTFQGIVKDFISFDVTLQDIEVAGGEANFECGSFAKF